MITCSVDRISYTIDDVIADFPSQVYIRGKLYAKQGLVTDIKFTNYNSLVANVQGTERRPSNYR